MLAAEMGANPGNWVSDRGNTIRHPTTEFGVARQIAYGKSQAGRGTLAEADYATVFATGAIDGALANERARRRAKKRRLGHIDGAP